MGKFVVIKDLLNVRSRPSLQDENFIGTLRLGEEVDLLEDPIDGEIPAGTADNIWLSDTFNRFVSRAGVAPQGTYAAKKAEFLADGFNRSYYDENDKENETKWKISWGHIDLEIWKIWKDHKTQGEGVKVAVIDTGATSTNNDLKGRIDSSSVSLVNNTLEDTSDLHHGTMSAGLIGANGATAGTVYGIAPKCELIIIKAGENGFIPFDLLTAIKRAIDLKVDVISISIETYKASFLQDPNTFNELEKIIKNCKSSGPLIIAAVGDLGDNSVSYPASFDGCFSVGAYSLDMNNKRVVNPINNQNQFLKFLCPGNRIRTCSLTTSPEFYDASSAATAFAAGIFALLISSAKQKIDFSSISSTIQTLNISETISNDPTPNSKEGFGIISPYKFVNFLNSQK